MNLPAGARSTEPVDLEPAHYPSGRRPSASTVRSLEMLLLNENLARLRIREAEAEAAEARLAHRLVVARRWHRRAEQAARRARLAAAAVLLHFAHHARQVGVNTVEPRRLAIEVAVRADRQAEREVDVERQAVGHEVSAECRGCQPRATGTVSFTASE